MEFYLDSSVPLFFIYGLSFIIMGISAVQQSNKKISNFPLMRALYFLGGFGILHGLAEWVIMVMLTNQYQGHSLILYKLLMFLNASSFSFMMAFGIALFDYREETTKKIYYSIPWFLFILWLMGYGIMELFYFDVSPNIKYPFFNNMSRYFIGFPGGLISCIALYKNGNAMKILKMGKISLKFKAMGFMFLTYGILAGLVVGYSDFFPARIINVYNFRMIFGFPVEVGRAVTAVIITILFIDIIKIFSWEISEKISRLVEQQVITQERRKLARELHDVVIQKLFATGLQVAMTDLDNKEELKSNLDEVNEKLNEVIGEVRAFIKHFNSQVKEVEDMKVSITELVEKFQGLKVVDITLEYKVPPVALGQLSNDKLTHVYYIVQEALSNIVKHSNATKASIVIKSTLRELIVIINDNGLGYDSSNVKSDSYGIKSIKERTALTEGRIIIKSNSNGTNITLTIPWEEYNEVL